MTKRVFLLSLLLLGSIVGLARAGVPVIDGNSNAQFTGASSGTISLTTTHSGDMIFVGVFNESASTTVRTVSSVSDTASLSWTCRPNQNNGSSLPGSSLQLCYATASGTLSSDTITVTLSGSTDDASLVAFGLTSSANGIDSNVSLPGYAGSSTGTVTFSTSHTSDVLVGLVGWATNVNNPPTYPAGWTSIDYNFNHGGTNWSSLGIGFTRVTTAQSSATFASTGGGGNGISVVDAVTFSTSNQPYNDFASSGGYTTSGGTFTISGVTTLHANEFIYVTTLDHGGLNTITGISDTSSLSWTQLYRNNSVLGYSVWRATAPSVLSSDTITVTMTGGTGNYTATSYFLFSGAAVTRDANVSLPASHADNSGVNAPISVSGASTTAANTSLICFYANNFNGVGSTPPTGFVSATTTGSNSVLQNVSYEQVSSAQSGVTITYGSSEGASNNAIIVIDAITSVAAGGTCGLGLLGVGTC